MTATAFTEAICLGVTRENWNVKTFRFSLAQPQESFRFKAGQYVTLSVDTGNETLFRCYTISSAPDSQGNTTFDITVKRSPTGAISTWLHDRLTVGKSLHVSRPAGDFILPGNHREPLLFVAGGVGITPLISMARAIYAEGKNADIQFLQFARTSADILFHEEMQRIARSSCGISAHFYTSEEANREFSSGLLSNEVLDQAVPDWTSRQVLCCGPDAFMSIMRSLFLENGGSASRFHQERFQLPEQAPVHVPDSVGISRIRLSRSLVEFDCTPGTTILDALHALPNGPKIPNACRSGLCGTCKLRKLDGQVEMNHNGGITDEEIDEGYVLPCCSVPLSDVTIEY
ncbi:iron-sulfur cluster-binding domain-containing protein [Paraburkholderia sp. BL10I2N1]|uniref:flavin reductase family protein n=1 Tax=Paraburkholderia sp. BL10I2N1 TaxID=1938796 RepID=UPI00105E60A4|nr:iron-sulfur cluster-binding domain-containing protein [Paraburkholderia sp. BL10I2N1]TDN62292.1 ferredoxin-NADP reductase [Paraburkholderia sp. BL10I2N1]